MNPKLAIVNTDSLIDTGGPTRIDGGAGGGDNGDMRERVAKLEAILPTLATKVDVADLRTDIHKAESTYVKWSIGLAIAIVGALIGYLSLTKPTAAPQPQPIVIQLPAPPNTPAPPSK